MDRAYAEHAHTCPSCRRTRRCRAARCEEACTGPCRTPRAKELVYKARLAEMEAYWKDRGGDAA